MMTILAEAANASDPMISGNWLIGVIGAISTGAVAIIGKMKVDQVRRMKTSTVIENQPLPVNLVDTVATKEELKSLERRILKEITKQESAFEKERDVTREELGKIHSRLDRTSECIAEVKGQLSQIEKNLNRVLNILTNAPQ